MTIKIDGDNSLSSPAIQGSDANSGLRVDGNNIDNVVDGQQRLRVDGQGIQVLRPSESFSQIRRTGSVSNDDYIGAFSWKAQNSSGTEQFEYVKVNTQIKDVTAGSENSRFIVETRYDGSMHSSLELQNGVHSFPRLPYCTGGQNAGWTTFQAAPTANYGILPSNGSFFTNAHSSFYAGSAINGYKVIHARHSGIYLFMLTLYKNASFEARVSLRRNNSHEFGFIECCTVSSDETTSVTCIETLNANDYINLQFSGANGGSLYTGDNHTTVSIVKIG